MKSLGIDWGHRELCFALLEEDGCFVVTERWDARDVPGLLERLHALGGPTEMIVCIESGAPLLRDTLRAHGYGIEEISPGRAVKLGRLHFPGGAKDDARDARTLALAGLHRALGLTSPPARSAQAEALRGCAAIRTRLVRQRTRVVQQLTDLLRRAHPGFAALDLDLRTRYALRLLAAYPDPRTARRARRSKVSRLLARCRTLDADTVLASLRRHGHVIADHAADACALELPLLLAQIELLDGQVRRVERRIGDHSREHPDRAVLQSAPGLGSQLFPRIATRMDSHLARTTGAKPMQILAGTAPRTRVSGKRTGGAVLRRVARDRDLHQALIQMARCSLRSSAWARAFVRHHTGGRMRDQKRLNKALRALANKWVRILHHLLRTGTTYDEQRHCDALRRNGVPWAPKPVDDAA
jgi:hypothetical protein